MRICKICKICKNKTCHCGTISKMLQTPTSGLSTFLAGLALAVLAVLRGLTLGLVVWKCL